MHLISKFGAGLALALAGLAAPAEADEADLMVVFDASGSMWGQIDGVAKIEIAREAFGALSASWAEAGQSAGLIAYGHRRRGDCGDIELISEPSPEAAAGMAAAVAGLTPKGKTPLSAAVRMAAETLKFRENAATVILLSDGIETCDLDPCAVGSELEALGIDFTAHVIGFDIQSEADKAQLQCLAENTGGQYLDASNAQDLGAAMSQMAEAAPEPPAGPVPLRLFLGYAERTKRPARVAFAARNEETGEEIALGSLEGAAEIIPGLRTELPAGRWTLSAEGDGGAGQIVVDLPAEDEEIYIPFAASDAAFEYIGPTRFAVDEMIAFELRSLAPLQENATYYVMLLPAGAREFDEGIDFEYRFGSDPEITPHDFYSDMLGLEAGNYEIIVIDYGYELEANLGRFPIEVVEQGASLAPGSLRLRAAYADGAAPEGRFSWSLRQIGDWDVAAPVSDAPEFLFENMPSGRYEASVHLGAAQAYSAFEFDAAAPGDVILTLPRAGEALTLEQRMEPLSAGMGGGLAVTGPWREGAQLRFVALEGGAEHLEEIGEAGFVLTPVGIAEGPHHTFVIQPDGGAHYTGVIDILPASAQEIGDHSTPEGEDPATMMSPEELAAERAPAEPPFEVWQACDGPAPCMVRDPRVGLAWRLPAGWVAEEPFYYTTAGGAQAEAPTVHMAGLQNGLILAALNPRQWDSALGPCEEVPQGMLCREETLVEADLAAYERIRDSFLPPDLPLGRSWTLSPQDEVSGLALLKLDEPAPGAMETPSTFMLLAPEALGLSSDAPVEAPLRILPDGQGGIAGLMGGYEIEGSTVQIMLSRPGDWDGLTNQWSGQVVNMANRRGLLIRMY